jgi:DNA oxidative demethylase
MMMKQAPEGVGYYEDFLSLAEQDSLLREVRALPYEHDVFRKQLMKRAWAQFGYKYVAIGRKLEPAPPIPPYLKTVIEKAAPFYPTDVEFDQCIVTLYPPGSGIGWHTDAPRFGEHILGVSLASPARLQFRPNKTEKASFEVTATPGSLYVIQGIARWRYQHRLVPVRAERYSLTFRSVA